MRKQRSPPFGSPRLGLGYQRSGCSGDAILAALVAHLLSSFPTPRPIAIERTRHHIPYYVLGRSEGELYAMDMTLSEEETRQYGREEETTMVTTAFVWTSAEQIEGFRQFVSITQGDPNSRFPGLVREWVRFWHSLPIHDPVNRSTSWVARGRSETPTRIYCINPPQLLVCPASSIESRIYL
jgi:hypothetical protein